MGARARRTWIGCCVLWGLVASCATSGDTSGTGGTGGNCATGCAASGGKSGAGGSAGAGSGGSGNAAGAAGANGGSGGGEVIGTSGGTVTQGGVSLVLPTNAVSAPTMITVAPTTAPGGYTLASQAYQFGPSGTVFAQPVVVTMPVTNGGSGVHMFWSNASGGFDDIGGTVSGSTISASVTHFSIGFCAVVSGGTSGTGGIAAGGGTSGGGGQSGGAGAAAAGAGGGTSSGAGGNSSSGAGGSSSSGAGGNSSSGAGGNSTGGAGGSSGTAGGSGTGAAGSSGAGGTSGSTDAGLGPDAAASLCKAAPLNLPFASINYPEGGGAAPAASTYTGGTLVSGRSYLLSVTQYGGGTYTGTRQQQMTIDTTAQTLVFGAYLPNTPGSQYSVMTYAIVAPNTLQVTVQCNSSTTPMGTFDMYYTVSGSQVTLTTAGSSDVFVY